MSLDIQLTLKLKNLQDLTHVSRTVFFLPFKVINYNLNSYIYDYAKTFIFILIYDLNTITKFKYLELIRNLTERAKEAVQSRL